MYRKCRDVRRPRGDGNLESAVYRRMMHTFMSMQTRRPCGLSEPHKRMAAYEASLVLVAGRPRGKSTSAFSVHCKTPLFRLAEP